MKTSTDAPREPLGDDELPNGRKKRRYRVRSLFGEPLLLPGEDRTAYDQLLADISAAVRPRDCLEGLWTSETATKHWEVLRQRRHKRGFIAARRQAGLQSVLKPLLAYGAPLEIDEGEELAGALAWKYTLGDADAIRQVEELLAKAQLSAEAVAGATMALHIETMATFDRLILAAEKRRDACLREIERYRAPFGRALRGAIAQVDQDRPATPLPDQKKAA